VNIERRQLLGTNYGLLTTHTTSWVVASGAAGAGVAAGAAGAGASAGLTSSLAAGFSGA